VDAAPSKPGDLVMPAPSEPQSAAPVHPALLIPELPLSLLQELWRTAEAEASGLNLEEFIKILTSVGERVNHGLPPGSLPDPGQKTAFLRSLHLAELALAHACALGREVAWERFLIRYRSSLVQAAMAITGSATLGQDLADSLYAELYGLRENGGERRSPLASYSGRGSLSGWLRTTLVQRSRDHYRRTHRETPLDDLDTAAAEPSPIPAGLTQLTAAVSDTLRGIAAEDRFLLSAYYLDRQTLLQIAQTIHVHEATISRRLKRLAENLHQQLLDHLVSDGMSNAAAKEALGADPRDIEINLRALLQTSQTSAFSDKRGSAGGESEKQ
jgi:RNA polymerase sigma-70 factor (ECF subfamily)